MVNLSPSLSWILLFSGRLSFYSFIKSGFSLHTVKGKDPKNES